MRGRKLWALCLAAAIGLTSLEWPGIPVLAAQERQTEENVGGREKALAERGDGDVR